MKRLFAAMMGVMALGLVAVLPACVTDMGPPIPATTNLKQDAVAPAYGLDLEQKQFARSWATQPPMVPHKFNYEVSLKSNECLRCHDKANAKKENAPAAGKSHYMVGGKEVEKMDLNRYFCSQCHAPQTKAAPLVENTFQGVGATPAK